MMAGPGKAAPGEIGDGRLRHLAYTAGWKKFEPLWDWVIRAQRVSRALPLLETVLNGVAQPGAEHNLPASPLPPIPGWRNVAES